MSEKTELFTSHSPDAKYAVDLLTRVVKSVEASDKVDYQTRAVLGERLWHEVCHAIGWDIDWDAVNRGTQG